jgi:hypothetical protein
MMKELSTRSDTKNALARLDKLHQANKLFKKDGSICEDVEARAVVRDAIRDLGLDIKEHVGIKTQATISGEVLHNLMILVRACSNCVCHVGAHDYGSGQSYYLGYYYSGMCA